MRNARRGVFELLLSQNDAVAAPERLRLAQALGAERDRYRGLRYERPLYDDNPLFVRDYEK